MPAGRTGRIEGFHRHRRLCPTEFAQTKSPMKTKPRQRFLDMEEARAVWSISRKVAGELVLGHALRGGWA